MDARPLRTVLAEQTAHAVLVAVIQFGLSIFIVFFVYKAYRNRERHHALEEANVALESRVKERTSELRESEERLRAILDTLPLAVVITHPVKGTVIDANRAAGRLFDMDPRTAIGHPTADFYVDPADRDRLIAKIRKDGFLRSEEVRYHTPSGREFWGLVSSQVVLFRGDPLLVSSFNDITERMQMEQALRSSEERYRALTESAADGIITIDSTGRITSWNRSAEIIFGWPASDMVDSKLDRIMPERLRSGHNSGLARLAAGGQPRLLGHAIELTGLRRDGNEFPIEVVLSTFLTGESRHYSGIVRDITDRKRAEEELRHAKELAEASTRAKSQFLASMSHELRTPMNAIIGFTRIVMRRSRDILPAKQTENLEKILKSSEQLLALINAILDLSKIESGRIDVNCVSVSVPALIESCVATVEPLLPADRVQLMTDFGRHLPAVYTDEGKLRQIVMNLLSNAVKFTPNGRIVVMARETAGVLEVSVADTGIGIPADQIETIFEEFRQVDGTAGRPSSGTGLGLTISRRLARILGGDIRVESTYGAGSTFTLALPMRAPPVLAPPVLAPADADRP
ncbi:MAG: PAS domain S-box protein [Alphaproteobacteria bacterium]